MYKGTPSIQCEWMEWDGLGLGWMGCDRVRLHQIGRDGVALDHIRSNCIESVPPMTSPRAKFEIESNRDRIELLDKPNG